MFNFFETWAPSPIHDNSMDNKSARIKERIMVIHGEKAECSKVSGVFYKQYLRLKRQEAEFERELEELERILKHYEKAENSTDLRTTESEELSTTMSTTQMGTFAPSPASSGLATSRSPLLSKRTSEPKSQIIMATTEVSDVRSQSVLPDSFNTSKRSPEKSIRKGADVLKDTLASERIRNLPKNMKKSATKAAVAISKLESNALLEYVIRNKSTVVKGITIFRKLKEDMGSERSEKTLKQHISTRLLKEILHPTVDIADVLTLIVKLEISLEESHVDKLREDFDLGLSGMKLLAFRQI